MLNLTSSQRDTLKHKHKSEKDGRTRDRIKAILLYDKGWMFKTIAEALLLDDETVSRHVNEYIKDNKLSVESGGSQSKLSEDLAIKLISHLQITTYLKVNEICAYVQENYNVCYTISGMTSWLKNNGFAYKKPKGTPAKADPIKQEIFIDAYKRLLATTPKDEPILFIDGVHPTMATKIAYGWIKKGADKLIATTASKTRINILGAINLKTMSITTNAYDTINSDAMARYMTEIRKQYHAAPQIHLILDQGSYNTSIKTKDAAKDNGVVLHYLPSYSPNLNPIERLWKVMNEYTRNNRVFKDAKEFRLEIMGFFTDTWPTIAMSMAGRINDNFQRLEIGSLK